MHATPSTPSTAKVSYVIVSSGQSLTDTTHLRPSLSICGRRFYASSATLRNLDDPFSLSLSLSLSPFCLTLLRSTLESSREKENQAAVEAFVRTFLGHLCSPLPSPLSLSSLSAVHPFVLCLSALESPCCSFEREPSSQCNVFTTFTSACETPFAR